MLNPNVNKPTPSVSRLSSEFSSSQLVIATCVFLIMALVCFALGVLVGRYDAAAFRPKQNVPSAETAAGPSRPFPPAPRGGNTEPQPVGVQKSPRPVVMPPTQSQTPGFPSADGAAPSGPRVSEHPAPPAKPETPAAPSAAPVSSPPSKPETPAPPAATTEVKPAAPSAPSATTTTPPESPKPDTESVPPVVETPAGTTLLPATAAPGVYGIQVASFSGANRQQMAEASKKRLEANTDMKADLLPSEDGKIIRVIVGHYPDKDSAAQACAELKKRAGFADCFPRKR
ncbi:MAG TPA: SPOR domain-containing protein [Candidatus Hydrogenedentes bacterium]|nr:SPOR domain-containing protein [Candidatus Hydrogenedentota bacterium]